MQISQRDWNNYVNRLARINRKAADAMQRYIELNGLTVNPENVIRYAYIVANKYGEAAAELACEMYDATALAQGASVPAAVPAQTATYDEVGAAIGGALKQSAKLVVPTASRLVKQAASDTILQNAKRDGAEWAWIPHGAETCAFCITLASNGWQKASRRTMSGGHADHIHANCQCEFAIRFDGRSNVSGYDPGYYRKLYYGDLIDDDIKEEYAGDIYEGMEIRRLRKQLDRNYKRTLASKDNSAP